MIEANPLSNLSYTNKDFQTIYPELLDLAKKVSYKWDPTVSNESDPGVLLLKLCAIIADKNDYNIDKNVLECFPLSVTQESNARQLFEQLGYNMHWYIGGTTKVSLAWIGEKPDTEQLLPIPKFTMVCDEGNSTVYTLIDDVVLGTNGETQVSNAIQGVAVSYTINGDDVITPNALDSNNRLYFIDANVAENGIFIQNADGSSGTESDSFGGWARVDNLAVEELGKSIYKFGVVQNENICYIEFPEDAEYLMGQGIRITYVKTNGLDGNIASKALVRFYNDVRVQINGDENEDSIALTTENVQIANVFPVENGKDPETIESAYKNYRKTVGTFNTLVTLRDYTNAINSSDFVSNGFVCDRTNDIQTSYKIVSFDNGTTRKINEVESNNGSPYMDAFDLKLYALQYITNPNTAVKYNNTFDMLVNDTESTSPAIDNAINYISDMKCIQHDFQVLLRNRICMIKNKYPIICKIIPQYRVSDIQAQSIRDSVFTALYNALNAKEIDFGEEISYDFVYNTILESDERIKAVVLDTLAFGTYVVYYDGTEYKEVRINSLSEQNCGYYNNGHFYRERTGSSPSYSYSNEYSPLVDGAIYTDISTDISYIYSNSQLIENLKTEFQNEIYAKSVLNGNTQLLKPDEDFDYSLNQNYKQIVKSIEKITTEAIVEIETDAGVNVGEYKVKDGEHIFLYAPNLVETAQYSTYVKYQYYLLNNVEANADYMLSNGESITFYWKDSDDADYIYYKYGAGTIISPSMKLTTANNSTSDYVASSYNEGKGTVVSSADNAAIANLTNHAKNVLSSSKSIAIKKKNETELDNATNYCYWILNTLQSNGTYRLFAANATDPYILQAGEYFIYTNAERSELVILGSGTKITRANSTNEWSVKAVDYENVIENGIYALEDVWFSIPTSATVTITETQFISINAGSTFRVEAYAWVQDGTYSATGTELTTASTTPISLKLKAVAGGHCYNSADNVSWTAQPTEIDMVFDKDGCGITAPVWSVGVPYTLSDLILSYKTSDTSDYIPIADVKMTGEGWSGKSILNFKSSPTLPQQLYANQTITYYLTDGTSGQLTGSSKKFILSDYGYDLLGGTDVDVSRVNQYGTKFYMNLYEYLSSESSDADIVYESDGDIVVTMNDTFVWVERDDLYNEISELAWTQDSSYSATGTELTVAGETPESAGITKVFLSHCYNSVDLISWSCTSPNYRYTITGAIPPDNLATYGKKAYNVVDTKAWVACVSKSIEFNLPLGKYILPVITSALVGELGVSVIPYYNTTARPEVTLSPIYDSTITTLTPPKTYPLELDLQSIYTANTFNKVVLKLVANVPSMNTKVVLRPIFKYVKPAVGIDEDGNDIVMSDGVFNAILHRIFNLDKHNIFDYTYVVDEDELIENPLSADSFLDANHLYNKFMICQIDTKNTNVAITNKVK